MQRFLQPAVKRTTRLGSICDHIRTVGTTARRLPTSCTATSVPRLTVHAATIPAWQRAVEGGGRWSGLGGWVGGRDDSDELLSRGARVGVSVRAGVKAGVRPRAGEDLGEGEGRADTNECFASPHGSTTSLSAVAANALERLLR